ncbi:MAG: nicotinate (nicotinamide) nucleotide adenylyltransferase [Candidatus Cryptobacteroides sp.]
MEIAVFSGSFNPLHIGHKAIIESLTCGGGFDAVYLVVSPKNPLKDTVSADSAPERIAAARAAVGRHSLKVKVDDIELNMPPPHYTIRTLDALSSREPDNRFSLVMGADNLADIHRWKDYERILTDYGVAVYPREGFDLEELKDSLMNENTSFRIRLIDAPKVDISSTRIRQALASGEDVTPYIL